MNIAERYEKRYYSLPKTNMFSEEYKVAHFGEDFNIFVFDMKNVSSHTYNLEHNICSFKFFDGSMAVLNNVTNTFTLN
jgi:hypothetical protein